MSISLLVIYISAEIIIVDSAPKLGHLLFDPLSFEADNRDENVRLFRRNIYKKIADPKSEILQENSSEDDFLENDNNSEDNNEPTTVINEFESTSPRTQNAQNISDVNDANPKKYEKTGGKDEDNMPTTLREKQNIPNSNSGDIVNLTTTQANVEISKPSNLPKLFLRNQEEYDSIKKSGYDYDMKICKLINGRIMCGYNKNIGNIESDILITETSNGCRIRGDRIECGYEKGPYNSPLERLKGADSKVINMLKDKKNQESENDTVPILRQDFKSIYSLLCTEFKSTTDKVKETTKIIITPITEIITTSTIEDRTTNTSTKKGIITIPTIEKRSVTVPKKQIITKPTAEISSLTGEKKEPTTEEKTGTIFSPTTETSTSTPETLSSPEAESDTEKTLYKILRKNLEPTDRLEGPTDRIEGPTDRIEGPTDRIEGPTARIEGPTARIEGPTDRTEVTTNRIEEPTDPIEEIVEKRVTRCVEIGDRIVCYNYKIKDTTKPFGTR